MKNKEKDIWIIADTHFGHDAVIKYCSRPENHSDIILENLNKNIKEGSVLIHLGDICFSKNKKWHNDLVENTRGVTRILVRGNHDKSSNNWYLNHGWSFVCDTFSDTFFGMKILFSHIPIINPSCINIHGHHHNNLVGKNMPNGYNKKLNKLISVEHSNYQPLLLKNLIKSYEKFNNQTKETIEGMV